MKPQPKRRIDSDVKVWVPTRDTYPDITYYLYPQSQFPHKSVHLFFMLVMMKD